MLRDLARAEEKLSALLLDQVRLGARPMPRVVATGIDALVFTAPLRPDREFAGRLDEMRRAAARGEEVMRLGVQYGPNEDDEEPFEVLPYGTRSGYRWLLRSPNMTIGISDAENMATSATKVELPAEVLWTLSPRLAYQHARRVLCALFDRRDVYPTKISRLDLACDFQAWAPSDNFMQCIVSKALRRRAYLEEWSPCTRCEERGRRLSGWVAGAEFCAWCGAPAAEARRAGPARRQPPEEVGVPELERFYEGTRFTGFRFGSGKTLLVRAYNKTLELERNSPGKRPWMTKAWERANDWSTEIIYDDEDYTWRLEPQLRREFLKSINPEGSDENIETVEDAFDNLSTIWRYVVGAPTRHCRKCKVDGEPRRLPPTHVVCDKCEGPAQGRGWVELREPTCTCRMCQRGEMPAAPPNPKRTLWPVAPEWHQLQEVVFEQQDAAPAARVQRRECDNHRAALMVKGCAARIASNMRLLPTLRRELDDGLELGGRPLGMVLLERTQHELLKFLDLDDFVDSVEEKDQLQPVQGFDRLAAGASALNA